MTTIFIHLPSKIYCYLTENQGRPIPFEELCALIYPADRKVGDSNDLLSAEIEYKTKVMNSLIFLSDIKLIILKAGTDESSLNLSNRN
ncbi:hypothetical protein [Flavobacterium sp. RS13.1]|uniref:hypothetical protein n=1 Tax=Flavobacterium sp. RS13.1 TaxID=3400345 RepID=UPI003AADBD64